MRTSSPPDPGTPAAAPAPGLSPVWSAPNESAEEAVSNTIDRVLEVLDTEGLTTEQRIDRIEVIVEDRFDFRLIPAWCWGATGRSWMTSNAKSSSRSFRNT